MTVSCERLDIYIAGKLCEVLTQNRNGALSFEYVHHYEGVPLSVSMPVGLERYGDRTVRPYLMGLLSDNASTRSLIGSKFGVSGNNPFKLLSNIGLDCPGAVQVCPHETDFELRNAEKGLERSRARISNQNSRQFGTTPLPHGSMPKKRKADGPLLAARQNLRFVDKAATGMTALAALPPPISLSQES